MRGAASQFRNSPPAMDLVEAPDDLVRATLRAAVRVTRQKQPLPLALSERTAWLVRATLAEGEPCPPAP